MKKLLLSFIVVVVTVCMCSCSSRVTVCHVVKYHYNGYK